MNRSPESITYTWLRQMKIRVSRGFIRDRLHSHPDFPFIASITGILDVLRIENAAMVVDKDKMKELPVPFLVIGFKKDEEVTIINVNSLIIIKEGQKKSKTGRYHSCY